MGDAREVLDGIEKRTVTTGATSYRLGAGYLRVVSVEQPDMAALVAALRAVLDLHGRVDAAEPWCGHCYNTETGFVDWPCATVRTVTEALGGTDD